MGVRDQVMPKIKSSYIIVYFGGRIFLYYVTCREPPKWQDLRAFRLCTSPPTVVLALDLLRK